MADGMQDPVLGPPTMRLLRKQIRECPAPMELPSDGHFVQDEAEALAQAALAAFVIA